MYVFAKFYTFRILVLTLCSKVTWQGVSADEAGGGRIHSCDTKMLQWFDQTPPRRHVTLFCNAYFVFTGHYLI